MSPNLVKHTTAVHRMYSTSGMLRTMELIVGRQYNAAALTFYECFISKPDNTPYKLILAQVSIDTRNIAVNESAGGFNHSILQMKIKCPTGIMNEVIWKSVKGESAVMPAPKRRGVCNFGEEEG